MDYSFSILMLVSLSRFAIAEITRSLTEHVTCSSTDNCLLQILQTLRTQETKNEVDDSNQRYTLVDWSIIITGIYALLYISLFLLQKYRELIGDGRTRGFDLSKLSYNNEISITENEVDDPTVQHIATRRIDDPVISYRGPVRKEFRNRKFSRLEFEKMALINRRFSSSFSTEQFRLLKKIGVKTHSEMDTIIGDTDERIELQVIRPSHALNCELNSLQQGCGCQHYCVCVEPKTN